MDLLLLNQNTNNCLSSLGVRIGDIYKPSEKCLDVLKEIYLNLITEDKITRNFRRALHFSRGFENDLIPLLLQTRDHELLEAIIKILACLLIPVECLLPIELSQTQTGQIIVFELKSFLSQSKNTFCDQRTTQVILEFMKSLIQNGSVFTKESCEAINNCLLILRNILHMPDSQKNLQNNILRNLFVQNIDHHLLHLMTHTKREYWCVATVQLVAVMFKDQHVGALQKLLQIRFERSLSESSEDNESNTTQDPGNTSSSLATSSDPSSDSSESGAGQKTDVAVRDIKSTAKIRKCSRVEENEKCVTKNFTAVGVRQGDNCHPVPSATACKLINKSDAAVCGDVSITVDGAFEAQDFSDYGYSSHVNTPETVSTSSKEDESSPPKRPFHQKPNIQKTRYCNKQPTLPEKKEVRRKMLMRRRKNNIKNLNMLANCNPRDEDITNMLAEFTMDFLTTGYEPLVSALMSELLVPSCVLPLDTSHFFWLLTYFLKFTSQLELNMDQVRGVLSFRVLAYLVYQGVYISEQVEHAVHEDADVTSLLQRQHLVVTAIREFILSLEAYDKVTYLSPQDKEDFRQLHSMIRSSNDLRCLFVLMFRLFRQEIHSRQYLEDLAVANHILLIFLEHGQEPNVSEFSLTEHLKQFARAEIMKNYGIILEHFQSNGEFLNDCVLTMMHHVGGEMNQVASLYQPNILKIFTSIWESDVQLCEDWSDLIEFVIQQFVDCSKRRPPAALLLNPGFESNLAYLSNMRGYINNEESGSPNNYAGAIIAENAPVSQKESLPEDLFKEHMMWLQRSLLEARQAKLAAAETTPFAHMPNFQPVSYYYTIMNEAIPLVTWNCMHAGALENSSFKCFLQGHGFEKLPGKVFYRIPNFWTPDHLLALAQKLGSIDPDILTKSNGTLIFTSEETIAVNMSPVQPFIMPRAKNTTSMVNQTPVPNLPASWLDVVKKSKISTPVLDLGATTNELISHNTVNNAIIIERVQPCNYAIRAHFEMDFDAVLDDVKVDLDENCGKDNELEEFDRASIVSLCNSNTSEVTHMCISYEEVEDFPNALN